MLLGLCLAAVSLLADQAQGQWDEFGVSLSQDMFANAEGAAGFDAKVASLRLSPIPAGTDAVMSLNGPWQFMPNSSAEALNQASTAGSQDWDTVEVPGDFAMQGYNSESGDYLKTVTIPQAWSEDRIKLRFDEVSSVAEVWVNGTKVGTHVGHFIGFEFDITDAVEFGAENVITVLATKESVARRMSGYSIHVGGGITQQVRLFRVPEVHFSEFHVATDFDAAYENATLNLDLGLANEGLETANTVGLVFELIAADGSVVAMEPSQVVVPKVAAARVLKNTVSIAVPAPLHWTAETPNLYTLRASVVIDGQQQGTVARRIGFREIEARGNILYVNGQPVKLHGSNRHMAHPNRGRSLMPELARQDAELFKAANCNFIRTSHYPPSEAFIAACDEIGLYVEEEAPFCFYSHKPDSDISLEEVTAYITYANLKMVARDRSHPSVIIWSIANESHWNAGFAAATEAVAAVDPTRMRTFMWYKPTLSEQLTVAGRHYPGPSGVVQAFPDSPTLFSEYAHLPAYARSEMFTDPAVDDRWGEGLNAMWSNLYPNEGSLGGAIWCGVDDTFYVPNGKKYDEKGVAPWGIIDGWRREKPNYWHVKKIYSPVKLDLSEAKSEGGQLIIPVDNRYSFFNLSELTFRWQRGRKSGTFSANVAPHTSGTVALDLDLNASSEPLHITVSEPDGRLVDEYVLHSQAVEVELPADRSVTWSLRQGDGLLTVSGDGIVCRIDQSSGMIEQLKEGNDVLITDGPRLAFVPTFTRAQQRGSRHNETELTAIYGSNWQARSVKGHVDGRSVVVDWQATSPEGTLDASYYFQLNGEIVLRYALKLKPAVLAEGDVVHVAGPGYGYAGFKELKDETTAIITNANSGMEPREVALTELSTVPRQLGLLFETPKSLNKLSWQRKGVWSLYPEDHIGRLQGEAWAVMPGFDTSEGPEVQPTWPWGHAASFLGTRDFRSTKSNILKASLLTNQGKGLMVISDGSQSSRSYLQGDTIHWIIAAYEGGPSEGFIDNYFSSTRPQLPLDTVIEDTIRLRVLK